MARTDDDGQAISPALNFRRLEQRAAGELIGIVRGVLADGAINQSEAEFLERWMAANAEYLQQWPYNELYARISEMLADGHLDHEEEAELLDTLSQLASPVIKEDGTSAPNEVLCDDPVPEITIPGSAICLTGRFVADGRKAIEQRIADCGGTVVKKVTRKTDFLVIGAAGSRDWLMSTHGTKIMDAAEIKRKGHTIAVVAERHFLPALAK